MSAAGTNRPAAEPATTSSDSAPEVVTTYLGFVRPFASRTLSPLTDTARAA